MGEARKEGRPITLSLEAAPNAPKSGLWVLVTAVAFGAATATLYVLLTPRVRYLALGTSLCLAIAAEVIRRARARRAGAGDPRRLSILVDLRGVWRTGGGGETACIARWDEPFGVTLLANPAKTRALFAFSSAERTRLVAVRIDGGQAADAARLCLDRAVPVTDADLDDALGGASGGLSGKSAAVLFEAIEKRAAQALGKILLFDTAGAKVTLEGDKLRARDKLIELSDPLEWRSFMFQEGGASLGTMTAANDEAPAAVTLYQATWAKQGPMELVLVCPLPAEASAWGMRGVDMPPPRELRVAVDRLFMIPLRKALEGAPRLSRAGAPPRKSGSHAIRT
jgi:hypothetical protein